MTVIHTALAGVTAAGAIGCVIDSIREGQRADLLECGFELGKEYAKTEEEEASTENAPSS